MNNQSTFVGLDTIHISTDKGNLLIQQRIEEFLAKLREEFCVGANHPKS